jgi:hypothetical protein
MREPVHLARNKRVGLLLNVRLTGREILKAMLRLGSGESLIEGLGQKEDLRYGGPAAGQSSGDAATGGAIDVRLTELIAVGGPVAVTEPGSSRPAVRWPTALR